MTILSGSKIARFVGVVAAVGLRSPRSRRRPRAMPMAPRS